MLIIGMSLTLISKLLHDPVTKIRDKAIQNRSEAMTHAIMLDELFDLQVRSFELAAIANTGALETDGID